MKSTIISITELDTPVPQHDDWICTAHGRASCADVLVAVAELQTKDAIQPYQVCQRWLTENTDAADYLREQGFANR